MTKGKQWHVSHTNHYARKDSPDIGRKILALLNQEEPLFERPEISVEHLLNVFIEGFETRVSPIASYALLATNESHKSAVVLAQRHRRPQHFFVF